MIWRFLSEILITVAVILGFVSAGLLYAVFCV